MPADGRVDRTGYIDRIRAVAREHGYAIAVHGSQRRDLDLVAVPWMVEAVSAQDVVDAICEAMSLYERPANVYADPDGLRVMPNPEPKPWGRLAWSLAGCPPDWQYVDLSVAPRAGEAVPLVLYGGEDASTPARARELADALLAAADECEQFLGEDLVGQRVGVTNGDHEGRTGLVESYDDTHGLLRVWLDPVARPYLEAFSLSVGVREVAVLDCPHPAAPPARPRPDTSPDAQAAPEQGGRAISELLTQSKTEKPPTQEDR